MSEIKATENFYDYGSTAKTLLWHIVHEEAHAQAGVWWDQRQAEEQRAL